LLFDGTVFEDDEMPKLGLGNKTGRRMGHLPISVPTAHSLGSPSAHSKQNGFFTSIIQTQYGTLSQMRIDAFKVLAGIFVTTDWYFRYDNETLPRTI
jgi:hypothetical protein